MIIFCTKKMLLVVQKNPALTQESPISGDFHVVRRTLVFLLSARYVKP